MPATFHASPKDAVDIHVDVRSRNSVAVHFGTFVGSESETHEAVIEFAEARGEMGVEELGSAGEGEKGRAGVVNIGESVVVEI